MVGSGVPFQLTTDVLANPLPLTVSAKAPLPAAAVAGASEETTGAFLATVIVNFAAFDMPPPEVGLATVTATDPAFATYEAATCAVSWPALT